MAGMMQAFQTIQVTQGLFFGVIITLLMFSGLLLQSLLKERPRRIVCALVILIAALGLRFTWIYMSQPQPLSDYEVYWKGAQRIYEGTLAFNYPDKHPGIFVFLAFAKSVFGPSLWAGWLLNLFFSTISLILIYAISLRLFNDKAALLALVLAAIHPQLITFNALMASELPAITLMLMITWAVLISRDYQKHWVLYWIGLGILLYGAVLTRSTYLLFIGLIPVLLLMFRRDIFKQSVRQYLIMVITVGAMISTWSYHQYLNTGNPKLFWGSELWAISTVQYDRGGRFSPPKPGDWYYPKIQQDWESGEWEGRRRAYQVMGEEARTIINRDPLKYLAFGFIRLKHMLWTTAEAAIRSSQEGSPSLQSLPGKTMTRFSEMSKHFSRVLLIVCPLGLLGFYFHRNIRTQEGLFFISSYLVCWLGFHYLIAIASDRWAIQIAPYIIILGAGGLGIVRSLILERIGSNHAKKLNCPNLKSASQV